MVDNDQIHRNLSDWIVLNGGTINPKLSLLVPDDNDDNETTTTMTAGSRFARRRGIFAKHGSIAKEEVLIRLQCNLALDGRDLPLSYELNVSSSLLSSPRRINASPWLRCLAALVIARCESRSKHHRIDLKGGGGDDEVAYSNNKYDHYLASLPDEYDSLLNWSVGEIRLFLVGTSLCAMMSGGDNEKIMQERFRDNVDPYLSFLRDNGYFRDEEEDDGVNPKRQKTTTQLVKENATNTDVQSSSDGLGSLYPLFLAGCMCISTRAFHMQSSSALAGTSDYRSDGTYSGPYLLPYIDLLNHASNGSPEHVTTLCRDADGAFVMVAERNIVEGEEIRHSYDSGALAADRGVDNNECKSTVHNRSGGSGPLNSAQLLQTFGFVNVNESSRKLLAYYQKTDGSIASILTNITPAVLSKVEICHSCEQVLTSSYPDELRRFMDESGLLEEGWECWQMPPPEASRELLTSLPDEYVVSFPAKVSDELITICCLHFLPRDVIDDLIDRSQTQNFILGSDALDDYFLGKMVLKSIINVVNNKLTSYISSSEVSQGHDHDKRCLDFVGGLYLSEYRSGDSFCWGENGLMDANVLSKLSLFPHGGEWVQKFMHGMIISLEERACLLELKNNALEMIMRLDEAST